MGLTQPPMSCTKMVNTSHRDYYPLQCGIHIFLSPSQQLSSIIYPTQGYTIPTFITFINHVTWECYSGSHISHLGPIKDPHVESPASNGVAEHSTYLAKESSNWGKRSNENGSETRSETRIQKYGVCNQQNDGYMYIFMYVYMCMYIYIYVCNIL